MTMHPPSAMTQIIISSTWKDQNFYADGIEGNKQPEIWESIGN
jgi:hypothetical protein